MKKMVGLFSELLLLDDGYFELLLLFGEIVIVKVINVLRF